MLFKDMVKLDELNEHAIIQAHDIFIVILNRHFSGTYEIKSAYKSYDEAKAYFDGCVCTTD